MATVRAPPVLGTESLVGVKEYAHDVDVVVVEEVVDGGVGGVGSGAFASFRSIVIVLNAVSISSRIALAFSADTGHFSSALAFVNRLSNNRDSPSSAGRGSISGRGSVVSAQYMFGAFGR